MSTLYNQYDDFAVFYDDFAEGYADDIPLLTAEAVNVNARKILELCSGTGRCCLALVDHGYEVVGIDSSPAMIEAAERKIRSFQNSNELGARISYLLADVEAFDLPEKQFDMVFATWSSLQHLTLDGRRRCYESVFSHLRPGGIFFNDEAIRPIEELRALSLSPIWYLPRPMFCRDDVVHFQYYIDQFDEGRSVLRRRLYQDRYSLRGFQLAKLDKPLDVPFTLIAETEGIERRTVDMELYQPDLSDNEQALSASGFQGIEYRYRPSKGGASKSRYVVIARKPLG